MAKIPVYTIKGTKGADFTLPKEFSEKPNLKLLAQAVHVYEERSHTGLRNTKTRSEINRTKKKVYKQKGTGGARHGSRRANVFVGGGVIFGPRPLRRILSLSDSLKAKAKMAAFSAKLSEDKVIGVTGIGKIEKTKEPAGFLKKLTKERFTGAPRRGARFTFVLSEGSRTAVKSLRNLEAAEVVTFKEASAYDIWNGGTIILDQDIFKKTK